MTALNFNRGCRVFVLTGCLLGLLTIPARAVFLIDDFDVPVIPTAIVDLAGGGSTAAAHSADGYPIRVTTVTATSGLLAATIGGGQIIDIQATAGGGNVTLAYSGASPNLTEGNPLASQYLFVDISQSINLGTLSLAFNVNGGGPAIPLFLPAGIVSTPYTVGIPLASIAPMPDLLAASFFDVFVDLNGGGTSITIDRIYTAAVPEPGTIAIWSVVALAGLGMVYLKPLTR